MPTSTTIILFVDTDHPVCIPVCMALRVLHKHMLCMCSYSIHSQKAPEMF